MERQEGEKLVLYRGHQLFVLGPYAAEIWDLCDGSHAMEEMVNMVVEKYGVEREKAKGEISSFLTRLLEKNLVSL